MDKKITLICDRCRNIINGYVYYFKGIRITSGFYEVNNGFRGFFNGGEFILCDSCVHSDERYQLVYGKF